MQTDSNSINSDFSESDDEIHEPETLESLKEELTKVKQQLEQEIRIRKSAEDIIDEYCNYDHIVAKNCKVCGIWYYKNYISFCKECGISKCESCKCPDCI